MQSHFKSAIRHVANFESEFLALVVDNIGEGSFKECPTSEFEDLGEEDKENDFYLEEEEEEGPSIKTAEFNKFINVGYEKVASQDDVSLEDLAVQSYNFAFGFNEGSQTVELVEGKLCRAIGVNIFIDHRIFPNKLDRDGNNVHNLDICYLNYDKENSLLYSGSNGKCSEIIEWEYECSNDTVELSILRRLNLPLNSLGVAFTFKVKDHIYCITKCSLHKQSELFGFEEQSSKRTRYEVGLGKVINLWAGRDIYLINETGLHQLTEKDKGFQLLSIYRCNEFITALENIHTDYFILGKMNGCVSIVNAKEKVVIIELPLADGSIVAIRSVGKFQFVASTNTKQLVLFQLHQSLKELKILEMVQLPDIAKNISVSSKEIYCCLKSGKIQTFLLRSNKLQRTTNAIEDQLNYASFPSKSQESMQGLVYSKSTNKYLYYFKNTPNVNLLEIGQQKMLSKVSSVELAYPTALIETHGTIIASIGQATLPSQSKLPQQTKQYLELFDFIERKDVFISQTLPIHNCTCIRFNVDGDKLALGFANGKIAIYNTNNCKETKQICTSATEEGKDYKHLTQIQSIIWSQDGRFLKTMSHRNLLFYGLAKANDDSYGLLIYDSKKGAEKEALKAGISKAAWTEMGKFNWRNAKIWATASFIEEIVQISETRKYLFTCLQAGEMKVYNNPALLNKCYNMGRWFAGPSRCLVAEEALITLIIYSKGSLLSVNVQEGADE